LPAGITEDAIVRRLAEVQATMPDTAHAGALQVATELGISQGCVNSVAERQKPVLTALRETKRDELVLLFSDRTRRGLERADPDNVTAKDFQALMVGCGIGLDKYLLLQGQPTSITASLIEHRHGGDDARDAVLAELAARGLVLADGQAAQRRTEHAQQPVSSGEQGAGGRQG
jgi:hypothetical protein